MQKLVYGFNPRRLRGLTEPPHPAPFTEKELAKIGIPARKIPRVQAELARLAAATPAPDRKTLLALAKEIARQLV